MQFDNLNWTENKFGERYFKEINKSAFQKQSSTSLFNKNFADSFKDDEALYVIIGTDSGLLVKYVQQYYDELKNSRFVFIDFEEVLEQIKEDFDSEKYERINIFTETFDLNLLGQLYSSYLVTGKIDLLRSIAVLDSKRDEPYGELWNACQESFQQFIVIEKNALDSKPFIDATLRNVSHNLIPLIEHRNALAGGTALVLGGGPSLDDALPWIKKVRDKLVIFSAGRIARRLKAEGIAPDFFVSVDPYDVSFDNSKGVFYFNDSAILLNGNHITPRILSQWSGPSCYMASKYPWHDKDGKMETNISAPGPNVINTAVNAAVELGCSQIILSGVDLCFPLGKAYESSSDEAKMGGRFTFRGISTVKDNRGEPAETQPAYANARHGLEMQVNIYKKDNPNLKFINTGQYSAAIDQVDYIEPDDIENHIELTKKVIEINHLKKVLQLPLAERQQRVDDSVKTLQKQLKRFKEVITLAEQGVKAVETLYIEGQEDAKSVKKAVKQHNKINKLLAEDGDMLFRYDSGAFKENFRPMDEEKMEQTDIENQFGSFFQGVERASRLFVAQLEFAINAAKLTLSELKATKSLDELEQAWQKHNTFGRVFNFAKWHPQLAEEQSDRIEEIKLKFYAVLENTDTQHVKNLERKSKDLPSLISRVEFAKETNNLQTLKELLEHFETLESNPKTESVKYYVKGIIADIEGHADLAVEHLKQADDDLIKEKSLLKILSICMKSRSHECSLQALEALCGISLSYMLPYSDLLKTIGHLAAAIQVLEMYVQNRSQDFDAWGKLIEYTHEQDPARAKAIANEVISYDPENQLIQSYL